MNNDPSSYAQVSVDANDYSAMNDALRWANMSDWFKINVAFFATIILPPLGLVLPFFKLYKWDKKNNCIKPVRWFSRVFIFILAILGIIWALNKMY